MMRWLFLSFFFFFLNKETTVPASRSLFAHKIKVNVHTGKVGISFTVHVMSLSVNWVFHPANFFTSGPTTPLAEKAETTGFSFHGSVRRNGSDSENVDAGTSTDLDL